MYMCVCANQSMCHDVVFVCSLFLESPTGTAPRLGQGRLLHKSKQRVEVREALASHPKALLPLGPQERIAMAASGRSLLASALETVEGAPLTPELSKTSSTAALPRVDPALPPPPPPATPPLPCPGETATPPPPAGFHASLNDWYLDGSGSIHHAGGVTSKVGGVDGRIVTTSAFGSRYQLLDVSPAVASSMKELGLKFDPEQPLADTAALLRGLDHATRTKT